MMSEPVPAAQTTPTPTTPTPTIPSPDDMMEGRPAMEDGMFHNLNNNMPMMMV